MDHASVTARAPHVRIVYGFGLGIESARAARIDVTDAGTLEIRRPGSDPLVVSAADVTQVVWLDAERTARVFASPWHRFSHRLFGRWMRRHGAGGLVGPVPFGMDGGSCVVLTDRGPVVGWLVDETAPGRGDPFHRRTVSGSVALARGLGLTLEPATTEDVLRPSAVRAAALRPSASPRWLMWLAELSAVGSLLASIMSWSTADGNAAVVLAPLALVLGLWVVTANAVLQRRALRLMAHPPDPQGRTVCRPAGLDVGDPQQLQIGADDIVVVDGDGGETWLPGPAHGGVATIIVADDSTSFHDARSAVLHSQLGWRLAADEAGREQLEEACRRLGIECHVLSVAATSSGSLVAHIGPGVGAGQVGVLAPWLLAFTPFALVPGGVLAAEDVPWLGWTVVVGAVAMLVGRTWSWWSMRRWVKSIERREES